MAHLSLLPLKNYNIMLHHLYLFLLLSRVLFQCILSVPVRVIVSASEGSSQTSSEHSGFKYSPVFEQSSTKRKQRPKKTYEERLEYLRERYQLLKKEYPDYLKEKNQKGYIKRREDPEKLARDRKYTKLYRSKNRAKMTEYQRKWRQRKKEREQEQDGKGKESPKGKRKGMNLENDQTEKKKRYKQSSKGDDFSAQPAYKSRKPIIARLKLSSETIEKTYGPKSPTK